jgi:hypothetical protein
MLPDRVWDRHANPKSGWTRLLAHPVLIAAIYTRKWRLFAAAVAFLVINPVLFSEPESAEEAWMSRVVRAEQRWTDAGEPLFGIGFPQVLNLVQVPVFCYNLYAAARRRPLGAVLSTAAAMGLKLWFVNELVKRTENGTEPAE